MNNYLLSIDPSIKNTGFTLFEKNEYGVWKPIFIDSYDFRKYGKDKKYEWNDITDIIKVNCKNNNFDLIIERGFHNEKFGRGKETLDLLRGNISGFLNKFLKKNNLIYPTHWQSLIMKWYVNQLAEKGLFYINIKWCKELSLEIANYLILFNKWDVKVDKNDNKSDSLLIGFVHLNLEPKFNFTKLPNNNTNYGKKNVKNAIKYIKKNNKELKINR